MKEYTVTGPAGEYTVQLSDEEAKARGLTATESRSKTPANKAKTPANKSATVDKRAEAAASAMNKG